MRAYRHALHRFLEHVDELGLELQQVTPKVVAAYLKSLRAEVRGPHLHRRPGAARSRR